jgi:hypothetical protein
LPPLVNLYRVAVLMTDLLWPILLGVHLLVAVGLSLLGLHQVSMVWLSWRVWPRLKPTSDESTEPTLARDDWPRVTVQLPFYNERFMAQRSIRSAAALDYPRHLLQIQVLDDSTDDTIEVVDAAVAEVRRAGVTIEIVRRPNRSGFKAGALSAAMPSVTGKFIAMFDADFVPSPDFLEQMVIKDPAFRDPKVGFLQGRWGHLNRDESWLTRAQGAMHDGHFFVEQVARSGSGRWFNFNGSGGVWRKACIDDAGGWQTDTLTEDLDLSYRAWLRGWRGAFTPWVAAPGELPITQAALRRQQFRWARGSMQTLRKLGGLVIDAPVGLKQRIWGVGHMGGYLLHPLMAGFMISWPLIVFADDWSPGAQLPKFALWVLTALSPASLAFLVGMGVALRRQSRGWKELVPEVVLAAALGLSMVSSNTVAVMLGLFGRKTGVFERTPKSREGEKTVYRVGMDGRWFLELGLAVYLSGAFIYAAISPRWWWALPMGFYAVATWLGVVLQLRTGAQAKSTIRSLDTEDLALLKNES